MQRTIVPISPLLPKRVQLKRPIPMGEDGDDLVDPRDLMMGEPIVGFDEPTLTENGEGARTPKTLPSPRAMTPAQRAAHWITHLPYDPSCEICVQCRRPNEHHRSVKDDSRVIPLLVGDYGFIKDSGDTESATILVLKLYPYKTFFSCIVANKGPDPLVVARIVKFLKDSGLTHFAYRSDREPAIMAMIEEACVRSGRK